MNYDISQLSHYLSRILELISCPVRRILSLSVLKNCLPPRKYLCSVYFLSKKCSAITVSINGTRTTQMSTTRATPAPTTQYCVHGIMFRDQCYCQNGWTGTRCNSKSFVEFQAEAPLLIYRKSFCFHNEGTTRKSYNDGATPKYKHNDGNP